MKHLPLSVLFLLCLFGILVGRSLEAQHRQILLDKYTFALGHPETELLFTDQHLGNGSAGFKLNFTRDANGGGMINVEVFRYVPPHVATPALELPRIVLIFTDARGTSLQTVVLQGLGTNGVLIGDSISGFFAASRTVSGISHARYLLVRLYGSYL